MYGVYFKKGKPKSLFFIYQTIIKILDNVKCYILCIYTVGLISGDLFSRFCNGRNGNNGNNEGTGVQHAMIKPVYIKNSEIQLDRSNKINDFEMYESLHLKVGDNIQCAQSDNMWIATVRRRQRSV